jgi:2-keto-4-pentenoate hydratase/2-oxohepta-3-ene-1,7-dioic acid hydratase in catechol pathway
MRICRFNENRIGLVRDGLVYDVTRALDLLPSVRWPVPPGDALVAHLHELTGPCMALSREVEGVPIDSVSLNSPVANPTKIIGAPVNYHAHRDEARLDESLNQGQAVPGIDKLGLFLKAVSALAGAGDPIRLRFPSRRTDHEVELAVVIGRIARNVSRECALECVAGYAIGLDLTVRGTEERSMRKSIDGYAIVGPALVTADEVPDPNALELSLSVNGQLRQQASTRSMIFDVHRLIELASSFYTLYPGDIIMTGTPAGVGPIFPGDRIDAQIESLGAIGFTLAEYAST